MIRKIFALLALVGLAAAPMAGWAASATYDGTLTVNAWSQGGGTVAVSQDATAGEYGESKSSSYQQTASAISSILLPGSKSFTFYAFAKPAEGYKFAGWFTSAACEGSPESDVADGYAVTFSVNKNASDAKTYFAKFVSEASKVNIKDAEITLDPSSANYTGSEQTTAVTVKYGTTTLSENTDYTVSGDVTATGSASEDKTYTVTITAVDGSDYEGSVEKTWTIKAPTGSFDADALSTTAAGCTASGNTVSVSDSTKLAYVAENTWRLSAVIKFPVDLPDTSATQNDPNVKYIDEAHALISTEHGEYRLDIQQKEYKIPVIGTVLGHHDYINTLTWTVDIPLADVTAAVAEQKTALEYEISVGALAWTHSEKGLKPTTYKIVVPLEGIRLLDDEGMQVYPEPTHTHSWELSVVGGNVLTADCTVAGCEIGGAAVTLNVSDVAYGTAPNPMVDNGFAGLVRNVEIGEIGYLCPAYSDTEKWYTGDYTAVVTVKVENVDYELKKAFKITKPEGGYTSGFEAQGIGGYDVRFNTFAEAAGAVNAGDTIYYRGGDFNQEEVYFSSAKDITLDLGGKTITYSQGIVLSVDDVAIINGGDGVVTLVNGIIDQPVGYIMGIKSAAQVNVRGKFVFGEGMFLKNEASQERNNLKVTAIDGASLVVSGGTNQCEFATKGTGSVSVSGGDFTKDPSEFLAEGAALGVQKVEGYPFHVFSHTCEYEYTVKGAVITVTCKAEDGHDECALAKNPVTLTLTATTPFKNHSVYDGARIEYSEGFPEALKEGVAIKYYDVDNSTDLGTTAPSEIGHYKACVTLGGVTAEAAFEIIPKERQVTDVTAQAGDAGAYSVTTEGNVTNLVIATGKGWKYFAATNAPDKSGIEGWYAGFTIKWPSGNGYNFTRPQDLELTLNGIKAEDGETKRIFSGTETIPGVTIVTEIRNLAKCVTEIVWWERITPETLQEGKLVRELTARGNPWGVVGDIIGDEDGVSKVKLTIQCNVDGDFKLFDEEFLRYPLHEHDWAFDLNGGAQLTAKCAVEGCRYYKYPLALTLELADEDNRLCNAEPMEAVLEGVTNFVSVTKATVGDVTYFNSLDERLESAPIQPGSYTAKAKVSHAAKSFEATLQLGFTIRAGEIVIDGKHYEGEDTTTYFADTKKSYEIAFGKDFTAANTITANGEKKLDLAGFKVVAPADQPFFTNEGTLTILDSTFAQEGTISANPASPEDPILVNKGALNIESGIFLGAISNAENGVIVLTGGLYSDKPEKDWVADGYDLVAYGTLWQVVPHEHTYQFLPFGPVLSATCSHIFVKGRVPQLTDCTAREMLMVLVAGSRGSIEYMGDPVQPAVYYVNVEALFKAIDEFGLKNLLKELGITDFFEGFVTMIKQGIADGFNGGVDGGIADAILGGIRTEAEQKTIETLLKGIVNKLIAPEKDEGFYGKFRSAFVTKEEYEAITGAKVGEFVYTDLDGNVLNEAPADVGTYVMSAKVQTQKGNTVTIWSRPYSITPASLEKALVVCDPFDLNEPFVYSREPQSVAVKDVRIGGILVGGYQSAEELIEALKSGTLTLEGFSEILEDLQLEDTVALVKKIRSEVRSVILDLILGRVKLEEALPTLVDNISADLKRLFGGVELVADVDYAVNGTTNATEIGEYSFSVDGINNYTGSIKKDWSIVLATQEFGGEFKLEPIQGEDARTFGATVTYPTTILVSTLLENARIQISTVSNVVFSGSDLEQTRGNEKLTYTTKDGKLESVTWTITLTQEEIDALFDAGEDTLTYTITAGAYAGEGNKKGYQDTPYEFSINLRDLISCKHDWEISKINDYTLEAICTNSETCCRHTNAVVLAISENGERELVFDGLAHYAAPDGEKLFKHFLPEAEITYTLKDADGNSLTGGAVEVNDAGRPYTGAAKVVFGGVTNEIASELQILSAREFGCSSLSEKVLGRENCGVVVNNGFLLTKPQNLVYDKEDGKWHFALQVKWPYNVEQIFHAPQFTAPEDAVYGIDKGEGVEFELVTDKFLRIKKLGFQEFVKALVCDIGLSIEEIKAAAQTGSLTYTLKTGANTGSDDEDGLREAEFKIVIPITRSFELWRSEGNYDVREFPTSAKELLDVQASFADPVAVWTGLPVTAPALTVTYKGETLVENKDYVPKGETAAITVGHHRLDLVGIGDYEGVVIHDLVWEIRMMIVENWAMKGVEYQGKTSGHVDREDEFKFIVDVDKSENLELRDGKWYTGISIAWPRTIDFQNPAKSEVTDVAHATIKVTGRDEAFSAKDWLDQKVFLTNQYVNIRTEGVVPLRYVTEVDYMVAITREDVFAVTNANPEATEIVYEITLGSDQWLLDKTGLAEKTFQIVVPLDGLKLEKHQLKCAQVELPNGCRDEFVWRDANITFFDGQISYKGIPLVEGMDYVVEGVTKGGAVGEYTLTLRGITNFEGELKYTFKIVEPRRPFAFGAMQPIDFNPTPRWERFESRERFERERDFRPWEDHDRHGRRCPVDRRWQPYNPYANYGYFTNDNATTVFVVTNGDHLAYSLCGDKWYMGMTLDWPNFISPCDPLMTRLTGPWQARFALSTRPGVTNCVADIMLDDVFWFSNRLKGETMGALVSLYRYPLDPLPVEYVDTLAWAPTLDIATLRAARARGDEYVDYVMTAGSPAWACDPDGVRFTKFAIRIPLDIVLHDWCVQRWPVHDHDWAFWVDDLRYIAFAECFAEGNCDVANQPLQVNFAAPAQSKIYDGKPFTQTLSGLANYTNQTGAVVDPISYTNLAGGALLEGAPVEVGMYKAMTTVTVRDGAKKLFIWTTLTIEPDLPTRPFDDEAMNPIPGRDPETPIGEVDKKTGRKLTITCSTNLTYDAESKTWYAGFTVDWPYDKGLSRVPGVDYWLNPQFTDVSNAVIVCSEEIGELSVGTNEFIWMRGSGLSWQNLGVTNAVTNVTWTIPITVKMVEDALKAGQTNFTYTLTAGSDRWAGDSEGLVETTFEMTVPLESLILTDENGEQVWPVNWYNIVYKPGKGGLGEMADEKRLCGLRKPLTECAFTNMPLYLKGWSRNGSATVHFADRQVVQDPVAKGQTLTLTAVWTTKPVVSGDVEADVKSVDSVTIVPVGKTVAEGIPAAVYGTAPDFRYVAEFPTDGAYNIVTVMTEKDGSKTTITQLVKVDEVNRDLQTGKLPEEPVEHPAGKWSSTVDASKAGEFVAIAGGVEELVQHIITPEEKENDRRVEMRLVVERLPADESTYGFSPITNALRCACIKPFDLRLDKYVDGAYDHEYRDMTTPPDGSSAAEYNGNLEIVIPFRKEGRVNFQIVRYYEKEEGMPSTGSVDILASLDSVPAKGHEGYILDETAGTITLYISKFTTYALVWEGAQVELSDDMGWEYSTGNSVWFGRLGLTCTAGWASSISNLQFVFERRTNELGAVVAQLMSARKQGLVANPVIYDGRLYDAISLSRGEGHFSLDAAPEDALWDIVKKGTGTRQYVDVENTEVNVYQDFLADLTLTGPAELFGWVTYTSYECTYWIPVGSNKEASDNATAAIMKSMKILTAPLSASALNATIAYNTLSQGESDGCVSITEFSCADGCISGKICVGVGEATNVPGANIEAYLIGAKKLGDSYVDIAEIVLDENGRFTVRDVPRDYQFFKVRIRVINNCK